MREKLIKLIDEYTENLSARDLHKANFDEKFADYLLKNGVVVLPCEVGSTIYSFRSDTKQIYECIIVKISFYECTNEIQYFINDDNRYSHCSFSDIDKTVFLTEEEAEKAIERSKQ